MYMHVYASNIKNAILKLEFVVGLKKIIIKLIAAFVINQLLLIKFNNAFI